MPTIETVKEQIYWSYANLARAHAAIEGGSSSYLRMHHIIRNRLYSGLKAGRMNIGSIYDDERLKMTLPQACVYCGSSDRLSLDHLIPRVLEGSDEPDNLIWACRSCNSSKRGVDLLVWMSKRSSFPSIFLLRRYLKLVFDRCEKLGILDERLDAALERELPFSLSLLPVSFPPIDTLVLWVRMDSRFIEPRGL